ncbi:MAG: serine O-acetyltransferase [Hyphomicrobiaceae bacterium]|jgi:serine O-acetyltransferase
MPKIRITPEAELHLEAVIDSVTRSYDAGRGIDSLESSALPNQRKTVDAVGHLKHAIYMGYYSTRNLTEVNLRQHVGEHVYQAFETLVEQTARAFVYRRVAGGAPQAEDRARSERVVLEVFDKLPSIRAALSMDVEAAFEGDPSAESIEEIIFSYPACEAITVYRIAHEFYQRDVPMIPRIMAEYAHGRTGIDIHPGARIGSRFFIDHGTGVVVGETCEIGDNVKLYQGVTLGALSLPQDKRGEIIRGRKRHPTVHDNVTIYAGAKILGGETVVGANSVIGGNVWLTSSVAEGSHVTYQAPTCDGGGSSLLQGQGK